MLQDGELKEGEWHVYDDRVQGGLTGGTDGVASEEVAGRCWSTCNQSNRSEIGRWGHELQGSMEKAWVQGSRRRRGGLFLRRFDLTRWESSKMFETF